MSEDSDLKDVGDSGPPFGKAVQIKHEFPSGTASAFTNHLTVQHTQEGEFHITFFEINHPLIMGGDEEKLEQINNLQEITAQCVARVVISAERMPKFIAALTTNYENYEESRRRREKSIRKSSKE